MFLVKSYILKILTIFAKIDKNSTKKIVIAIKNVLEFFIIVDYVIFYNITTLVAVILVNLLERGLVKETFQAFCYLLFIFILNN